MKPQTVSTAVGAFTLGLILAPLVGKLAGQGPSIITRKNPSDIVMPPSPAFTLSQQKALIQKSGIHFSTPNPTVGAPVTLSARNPISADNQIFLDGFRVTQWFPENNAVVLAGGWGYEPDFALMFLGGAPTNYMVLFNINATATTTVSIISYPNHTVTQIQGTGQNTVMPVIVPKGTDSVCVNVPNQKGTVAVVNGVTVAPVQ